MVVEIGGKYRSIQITLVGNKEGVYINPRNCDAYVDCTKAENYSEVNFDGVDSLAIRREDNGSMKIFQAGGFSYDRGLFVDMY